MRRLCFLMMLSLWGATATGQPTKVSVHGNRFISRQEVSGTVGPAGSGHLSQGLRRLVDGYRSAGFLDADVRVRWSEDSTHLSICVSEGVRYLAGNPSFTGNSFISGRFLGEALSLRPGSFFDQRLLARDMARISRAYADAGFPRAAVRLSGLSLRTDTVDYGYDVTEGPLLSIAAVSFIGNGLTTAATADRLAGLKPGERFSAVRIERAVSRLVGSGLFTSAALAELAGGEDPGRVVAVFTVKEPRYNTLAGAAGYNQGAGRDGWLAGSVDLELRNISGTGRRLFFHWERLRQSATGLSASYADPWLYNSPVGVTLAVDHAIQDSQYTRTGGSILATVPVNDRLSLGAGGAVERVVPGSQAEVRRSQTYSTLWSIEGDHRRHRPHQSGLRYRLQTRYGRKRYFEPAAQLTVGRVELDADWSWSPAAGHAAALSAHARALATGERPAPRSDQYYLGGAATIRGFYEQQFAASQAGWVNAEHRLTAAAGFQLYPFVDWGYVRDRDRGLGRTVLGYGAGMRLDTRLGRIQVDYGLGRGDNPADGKVHLLLRNDF